VSLAQVSPYPLLALARGSMSRRLLDVAFQQAGVPMQVAMKLGNIAVIKRFVAIGLGLAIVPRVAIMDEVRASQIVAVSIHGLAVVRSAWSNAPGNVARLQRLPFCSSCARTLLATPEACTDADSSARRFVAPYLLIGRDSRGHNTGVDTHRHRLEGMHKHRALERSIHMDKAQHSTH
jgi:hypothetical protein